MIDAVIRKALEARIAAHGLTWLKLRHFELRSAQKKLLLHLDLEGEEKPVHLTARYRVEGDTLILESVDTSKKWITELASVALAKHGGRIALPAGLVGSLARVIL